MLKQLDRRLARLGSHSVTHPHLARLSAEDLTVELASSKQVLEALTSQRICSLALPYGSSSPTVVRMARELGYERVYANVPVRREGSMRQAHRTCRHLAQDWRLEFYLKRHGAYDWMALAVPAKRRFLSVLTEMRQA